ncbi:MAG: glycosyltransferase, partial [Candidatus Omnitrophica bacterium]|nr:glycosyltransferase [Candidatus Omnitrophota bacterium]
MSKANPKISVIIPVFDEDKYVKEAIDSVLSQSYDAFELIIVDDGSTDNTRKVLDKYTDPRIKIFYRDNGGQCAARNYGIRESSGEYIKFLDADDIINPEHLMSQYEAIKDSPGCVASCKWAYFVDSLKDVKFDVETTHKDYEDPVDWIYDSITYDKGTMGGWMWLIPRKILEKTGYWNEQLSLDDDFEFSIRVLLASSGVRFAPGAKLYYRKGNITSMSGTFSREALESAYLTTSLGRDHLLEREDSSRMRKLLADRFQGWVFKMYPENKDLSDKCEEAVKELGGSHKKAAGGVLFKILNSFLPWKLIRKMQVFAYKYGWG